MDIQELGIKALKKTYEAYEELGDKGTEEVEKNEFGEMALRMDIEAEQAVINVLKEAKFPIRVVSEEHGTVDVVENPKYLGVLDGLDGSHGYKEDRLNGRFATMFAIFSGLDPNYGDYLFCGIMEHSSKKLFFVSKGKGSFLFDGGRLYTSGKKELNKEIKIYADLDYDEKRNITFIHDLFVTKLEGFEIRYLKSSACHFIDLISGKVDLVLECTRKGNLEMGVAFGLLNEAGGTMFIDKKNVKDERYLTLGQDKNVSVVSAATIELAQEMIKRLD